MFREVEAIAHETALIATISVALALALVCGFVATRLGLPALVGYLLAGFLVGPSTPGFVADTALAPQLAEIGVILLMFGVGIHFSWRDLLAMRKSALPGAVAKSAVITALAVLITGLWGWSLTAGVVFGFALSVASTVVLLRALMDGDLLDSRPGRVVVAWLIVEDLLSVLVLVFLPALSTDGGVDATLGVNFLLTIVKLGLLVGGTIFVGMRVVPWLLVHIARTGSRELFTLSVLALAFGLAFGSATFAGVSMALGAFLAGLIMGESDLSHRAAEEALPMRDAFSVLFFISVGMLFDPVLVAAHPFQLLAVVLIVVVAKPLVAFPLALLFGQPTRTGLVVGAGLAQIGEFSFILAEMGTALGLLPEEGRSLILAAAIVSITVNAGLFRTIEPLEAWLRRRHGERPAEPTQAVPQGAGVEEPPILAGHAVLCGYGRVGRLVAATFAQQAVPYLVVEQDRGTVEKLREQGHHTLHGDAAAPAVLERMNLKAARLLVLAIVDPIAIRQIAQFAREQQPGLPIVARTHSEEEWMYLSDGRVDQAVLGEHELARTMARAALGHLSTGKPGTQAGVA